MVIQMAKIYFSDIFGLHPHFLKPLYSHKGETDVLLLIKENFGPQPWLRGGEMAGCQEDQPCELEGWNFQSHSPTLPPPERKKAWRLNQPMANDLVNHSHDGNAML